jgi:signal transduction histidine kinase
MEDRQPLKILAVEDNPADFGVLRRRLNQVTGLQCELIHCSSAPAARDVLANQEIDCLFLDYHLGAKSGLDLLTDIRNSGDDLPVIALTGQGNETIAVEAMKRGAQDYLVKDEVTPETLYRSIRHAIEKVALNHKLAEIQEEISQFASVAAHDLKVPLRRVIQLCQLIQNKCKHKFSQDEAKLFDSVIHNTQLMNQLIEALLDYTRVGRSETPLKPVELSQVLTTVLTNLDMVIVENQAQVTVGVMPRVLGDETALAQLFQNLIANALKFRSDQPPVVTIASECDGDMWHLTVSDNGIGIDSQNHETIFAPFNRLHSSREFEGSGIGLATCQRIVQQHHGRIWAASALGAGSTFHVTLPMPGTAELIP